MMVWRWLRNTGLLTASVLVVWFVGRWLLSLPLVAALLVSTLTTYPPITPDRLRSAEAIVVISGGAEWVRAHYAARLQRESNLPILVSGGNPPGAGSEAYHLKRVIEQVDSGKVRWFEDQASNTHENASLSAEILLKDGIQRIALVTDEWHMRRASYFFGREGLSVIPAPVTPSVPLISDPTSVSPSPAAFAVSSVVFGEWLRILWGVLHLDRIARI